MLSWLIVSSLLGEVLYTSFRNSSDEDCPEPRYLTFSMVQLVRPDAWTGPE